MRTIVSLADGDCRRLRHSEGGSQTRHTEAIEEWFNLFPIEPFRKPPRLLGGLPLRFRTRLSATRNSSASFDGSGTGCACALRRTINHSPLSACHAIRTTVEF